MPRKHIPPNISTPVYWKYVHNRWNMHNSVLCADSTGLNRLLPCRIFQSALSYPPKVSTAPKISTCFVANPENTYVLFNPLSAIWRIYPSSKWSSQWPYDGYIRHEWMTCCGRGRDSATWECFGRGSLGTIFVRSSKLSLFFPELCPFRRVFCFPRFWKIWRQTFKLWGFWFRRCLGGLFENSAPSPGIFLRTPTTWTTTTSIFLKISFLFSKTDPMLLAWPLVRSPSWAKHFCDGTSKTRMKTWLPCVGETERRMRKTLDHRRNWHESCAAIHGPKEKKNKTRKSACDCAKAQPFIIYKPASFEEPVSETRCRYRIALRCLRGRGCTAAGRWGCSAGKAKKSSHPWHFRYWSLRRNELECTNLVRWTGALHRFSSRDAIIVVGFVLEKHFGGDFTRDQEQDLTFKRWPPGYQSWKLALALNGLTGFTVFQIEIPASRLPSLRKCLQSIVSSSGWAQRTTPKLMDRQSAWTGWWRTPCEPLSITARPTGMSFCPSASLQLTILSKRQLASLISF